jgi:LuxR family quorum sensing-dependent transcriptional regulator
VIHPAIVGAYETLGAMESAASRATLADAAILFASSLGAGAIALFAAPSAAEPETLLSNWPPELAQTCAGLGLWRFDPAFAAARDQRRPVEMAEASRAPDVRYGFVAPVLTGLRVTGFLGALGPRRLDAAGQAALCLIAPTLARRALATPGADATGSRPAARPTPRELECLALSAAGLSSTEIAAHLALSEHTVNTHLRAAIEKLRAASRVQAVAEAMRRGWIA